MADGTTDTISCLAGFEHLRSLNVNVDLCDLSASDRTEWLNSRGKSGPQLLKLRKLRGLKELGFTVIGWYCNELGWPSFELDGKNIEDFVDGIREEIAVEIRAEVMQERSSL